MNRILALILCCPLLFADSLPVPGWVSRRFNPATVQPRDVQGLAARIADGKLRLTLRQFLELVLANSTDINITRLDVYTSADQVRADDLATLFAGLVGPNVRVTRMRSDIAPFDEWDAREPCSTLVIIARRTVDRAGVDAALDAC